MPVIVGCSIALLIAVPFLFWAPAVSAIVTAGFLVGLTLKRWWLVPIPFLIAIPLANAADRPCPTSASECDIGGIAWLVTLALGVLASLAVLIGVSAARLSGRGGATSLRRRSS